VALCNAVSSEAELERKAVSTPRDLPQQAPAPLSVADRLAAFLEGGTHGEDLLHELYDYVLDEPIPQRIREILDR
jgi:hypothetical protein